MMNDTTVQGDVFAADLAVGFWHSYTALVQQRQIDRVFEPSKGMEDALAKLRY